MNRSPRLTSAQRRWLSACALVTLSQCALPPGTAWTVIRKDGFRDYLAISWGKKPVPEYVKELVPEAWGEERETKEAEAEEAKEEGNGGEPVLVEGGEFPPLPLELPEDWTRPVEPVFPLMSSEPPELTPAIGSDLTVRDLAPPPLLAAVTDSADLERVKIPSFLPETVRVSEGARKSVESGGAPGLKIKEQEEPPALQELASRLAGTLGKVAETEVKAEPKEEAAVETDAGGEAPAAAGAVEVRSGQEVTETGAAAETMPTGVAVPGRPGHARSPHAKEHQIVDVTGLKAGDAVKCPFSGKMFRVPEWKVAMNRAPAPGGEAAAREEAEEEECAREASAEQGPTERPGLPIAAPQ
jgi:hypothetical protein